MRGAKREYRTIMQGPAGRAAEKSWILANKFAIVVLSEKQLL